tara:strand:- start:21 stop:317 length:297 start_codon:yes stop_codon:yes gene_type:complete
MKISFRTSEDKLKCKIFLDEMYLGYARLDIWAQKWFVNPSFHLPYNFTDAKKKEYNSSYEAGKAMVELYNFLFPESNEETQEFGIGLSEMLMYLKARI